VASTDTFPIVSRTFRPKCPLIQEAKSALFQIVSNRVERVLILSVVFVFARRWGQHQPNDLGVGHDGFPETIR
jgi:hypothetical protein